MEYILLKTLGIVTRGHQWARRVLINFALFDTDVLVEFVAVGLDFVDNDAPFAFNVNGPQRLSVRSCGRTQISLLFQFTECVNGIHRVDNGILIKSQNGLVVLVQGVLDIVDRVFRVFQTPGLGGVLGAGRDLGFVVVGWFAVSWGSIGRLVWGVGQNGHETQTQDLQIWSHVK